MTDQPLVIMAGRSTTSYLLINHLAAQFPVALVMFEAPHTRKMLRYRLRVLGAAKVAAQMAFLVYDRLMVRPASRARIAALLDGRDVRPPDGRLPVLDVDSVNSDEARERLAALKPSVVVVSGTGIIGKKMLALAPVFLNIHAGITPRYRGVHGAFWAIYENRPELAGVTVHKVDPGIDTGAIVAQAAITVDGQDTYRTLPVKQYLAGLPLMESAVRSALAGRIDSYHRDDLESRQWYSPTPGEYRIFLRHLPGKS